MATYTPTANDAYISAQHTARAQIEAIAEAIEVHQDETPADGRDWGRVGDLGYVNAQLAEVLAFLGRAS